MSLISAYLISGLVPINHITNVTKDATKSRTTAASSTKSVITPTTSRSDGAGNA